MSSMINDIQILSGPRMVRLEVIWYIRLIDDIYLHLFQLKVNYQ